MKLGRWDAHLAMRTGILRLNADHRDLLSNDLGAVAGLLFDVGRGRYFVPPREGDDEARASWEADLARVREDAADRRATETSREGDRTHTEVQAWLRDLGRSLGFEVEHTTSIYSGILRLLDLAGGAPSGATREMFLVAPDDREKAVRA